VQSAVADCKRAGIFVRMVTGDNVETAKKIAEQAGIYTPAQGGTRWGRVGKGGERAAGLAELWFSSVSPSPGRTRAAEGSAHNRTKE